MKKILSCVMAAFTAVLTLLAVGCGQGETGSVYYLNFKPEQDAAWQKLAADYTKEKGVEVKVVTAASGKYEETLTAELDKDNAPTLFQINGTVGYQSWKDYCLDLKDSKVYKELTSDDWAVKDGSKVAAIAYVYEGYGIITNKTLLAEAGYNVSDITSFATLKSVVEGITAKKEAGDIDFAAFASNTLDGSSSWRFSGHLANIPLYYEFAEDKVNAQPATIKGTYLDEFQAIWDLYTNNSTVDKTDILTPKNAAEEFAKGEAVFYQNGTWAYVDVVGEGKLKDSDLAYLPIYAGINDAKQGLCCGTENYWAVNSTASKADQKATLDFLEWVVTSEKGTTALANDMGFISPFKKAKPVSNVLCNIMNEYTAKGCYNVSWAFNYTPNVDAWRADVVSALAAYTAGTGEWTAVETAFVTGWANQYNASKQ